MSNITTVRPLMVGLAGPGGAQWGRAREKGRGMEQRKTWRIVAVAVMAVVVGVAITTQQSQRDREQTQSPTPAVSSSPDAPPSPGGGSTSASPNVELGTFLRDQLPRRVDGDPMAKGAVDAPVVLTEWADYRCPYCSLWAEQTLPQLQPLIDAGTLRVEFRDLAIFGDESVKAATAARAAGRQGKYFEFQYALFAALPDAGHPDIGDDLIYGIVEDLGLDAQQFTADWADPALADAVAADSAEAQHLGISSTPSFVVGSQFLAGAYPLDVFETLIDEELAR